MASKVTLETFGAEIQKILKEYEDDVTENLSIITKKIGQKGAKLLKDESLGQFPDSKRHKTRYGQTWTSKTEQNRLYTTVTIYNRQAGLPHLLENGHALVAGGRQIGSVSAKTHIYPVEQELIRQYEREVMEKL